MAADPTDDPATQPAPGPSRRSPTDDQGRRRMTEVADLEAMDRAALIAAWSDIRPTPVPKGLCMPTETGPQRGGNGDEPCRLRDPMHAASGGEAAGISRGSDAAGKDKRGWRMRWPPMLDPARTARNPKGPRSLGNRPLPLCMTFHHSPGQSAGRRGMSWGT